LRIDATGAHRASSADKPDLLRGPPADPRVRRASARRVDFRFLMMLKIAVASKAMATME